MGYLEDLRAIINKVASLKGDALDKYNDLKPRSIARGALDGTLQFPCLVSDSIPIDMASTVARTLERVYASFVQQYLSMNNVIDISVDKNPNRFLKKFHKNIKLESTNIDTYLENCVVEDSEYDKMMERIYDGSTKAYINEETDHMIVFNFNEEFSSAVFESHKKGLEEALAGIDYKPFPNVGNSPYYEAIDMPTYRDYQDHNTPHDHFQRAIYSRDAQANYRLTKDIDNQYARNMEDYKHRNDTSNFVRDTAVRLGENLLNKAYQSQVDDKKYQRDLERDAMRAQSDIEKERLKSDLTMDRDKWKMRYGGELSTPAVLKDADVKKSNDLQPYGMQVRLMAINDKNEFVQFMDFIVGVKVILHNIKSDEMILNLQSAISNNGALFNFIRWTSGEKSLFKDLALHVDNTKLDVANKSKGSSPWWSTLKRLRELSKSQTPIRFFRKSGLVPQSTIVISAFDADIIEKKFGYNLRNPKFAVKLMNSLFLMNFIIVDEGTGTLEVLYDGETTYQTYALETLQREISMNSNKLGKELTRMISR